ncbi:GspH/FimT family pseudopilin [Pseudomonas aeruginosa]|nr:GspH/FimT family pseudopilin [Pseudomonas aeruginosa]
MPIRCCATTKRRRAGCRWRATATALPEWAELTFELDGQPLVLAGSKGEKEQKKGTDQPQLLILSSGELSPFRLRLAERGPEGRALSLSSDGFRLPRVEVARR